MSVNKRTVIQYALVILITIIIMTLIQAVWSKVDAYEVCAPARETVARSASDPCAPYTPKRGVKKFKKGKLGNSKGLVLPKKYRTLLNKRYNGKGRLAHQRGVSDWWDRAQESTACLFWSKKDGLWDKYSDCIGDDVLDSSNRIEKDLKSTRKTVLMCGGSAVLGYYVVKKMVPDGNDADLDPTWKIKRKGWHMIAAATVTCSVNELWKKWF